MRCVEVILNPHSSSRCWSFKVRGAVENWGVPLKSLETVKCDMEVCGEWVCKLNPVSKDGVPRLTDDHREFRGFHEEPGGIITPGPGSSTLLQVVLNLCVSSKVKVSCDYSWPSRVRQLVEMRLRRIQPKWWCRRGFLVSVVGGQVRPDLRGRHHHVSAAPGKFPSPAPQVIGL